MDESTVRAMQPVEERPGFARRASRELLKILLGVMFGLALMAGLLFGIPAGMNWHARKQAEEFCSGIKRGADLTALAAGFDKAAGEQHILHYEADDGASHTFLFEGFMFDKAACRVAMDKNRKAVSAQLVDVR